MDRNFINLLRCPKTGQSLFLAGEATEQNNIQSGWLKTGDGKYQYPIVNGIPRFVVDSNYADNFGMQWNKFSKTQLDSYSGLLISSDRFWMATGWSENELEGQYVLDVGCGAGRFAEIALKAGAKVVALDYSLAVDACYKNLKNYKNLNVIQANVYELPFAQCSFKYVYSLGVLQHTPEVRKTFVALSNMVAPKGSLCVDFYEKSLANSLIPKAYYFFRPISKRLPKLWLFKCLEKNVPKMLKISVAVSKVPIIGFLLTRLIPVANYVGIYNFTEQQHIEWALLDTFDNLAPQYDQPQKTKVVKKWFTENNYEQIKALKANLTVVRGKKKT